MDGFTLDIATPSSYGALSPGQNLVAVGLGDTTDGGQSSDVLLEVDLPFVSHGECEEAFETDPGTQMCAGDSSGRDTCQGTMSKSSESQIHSSENDSDPFSFS